MKKIADILKVSLQEVNKAIEGCRTQQMIGAALETEVNYLPENEVFKNSLSTTVKLL